MRGHRMFNPASWRVRGPAGSRRLEYTPDPDEGIWEYHPQAQRHVMMDPQEFLALTARPGLEQELRQYNHEKIDRLRHKIEIGMPLDRLNLWVDPRTGKITGHEGRHRAMAAIDAGVAQVPVVILFHYPAEWFTEPYLHAEGPEWIDAATVPEDLELIRQWRRTRGRR